MSNLVPVGALRFNTESNKLEYFDGTRYVNITTSSAEQNSGTRGGVASGGYSGPAPMTRIEQVNIATTGNAVDFGETSAGNYTERMGGSNHIYGFYAGGYNTTNPIGRFTIAIGNDAIDFGDLIQDTHSGAGASNRTRLLMWSGSIDSPAQSKISAFTMASAGNAEDFGDQLGSGGNGGGMNSPTRALFAGTNQTSSIQYVTTSTFGNASAFGELSTGFRSCKASSNATRGIISGGYKTSDNTNIIDFIQLATLGDAVDFGDLSLKIRSGASYSSPTRCVATHGGYVTPNNDNTTSIQYVEIASKGNAIDFGDTTIKNRAAAPYSNCHGGLG